MAYTQQQDGTIILNGIEQGIADSPYTGIADMRNVNFYNYFCLSCCYYYNKLHLHHYSDLIVLIGNLPIVASGARTNFEV